MKQEVEVIVLEDKQEYLPTKTVVINGIKYYALVNVNDTKKICFRKEIEKNGETYISMLANKEELEMVINKMQ